MKKTSLIVLLCLACCISGFSQNTLVLREDNIDEILQAMTVEEKVSLLVGGPGSLVPGAAGNYQVLFGASVADIRATTSFRMKKAQAWKVKMMWE